MKLNLNTAKPFAVLILQQSTKSMSVTSDIIPLPYLQIGQSARVEELLGDDAEVKRLEEIGIRAGERVEMVQRGSPCIVRVGDCKLCFRTCEMLQVLVRIGEAV